MEHRWTIAQARKYLEEQLGDSKSPSYILQFLLSEHIVETIDMNGVMTVSRQDMDEGIELVRQHPELHELIEGDLVTTAGALDEIKQVVGHRFSRGKLRRIMANGWLRPAHEVPYKTRPYHLFRRSEVHEAGLRVKAQEMREQEELERLNKQYKDLLTTGQAIDYLSKKFGIGVTKDAFYHQVRRLESLPSGDPKHMEVFRHKVGDMTVCYYRKSDLDNVRLVRGMKRQHKPEGFKPIIIHDTRQLVELEEEYGCRLLPSESMWEEMCKRVGYPYSYEAFLRRRGRHEIWPVAVSGRGGQWFPESQLDNLVFIPGTSKKRRRKEIQTKPDEPAHLVAM